jgi:protein-S-isoprenylcysteine O-methyltransferase Ste14
MAAPQTTIPTSMKSKIAFRLTVAFLITLAAFFLTAGTFKYWQGWVFLIVSFAASLFMGAYFHCHDPGLLKRRMETREKEANQRLFRRLWGPLWIAGLALPGFDYRFGWSSAVVGRVPLWLTVVAQSLVVCAYVLVFQVLKINSFASSTIQVEVGQKVISAGPYRLVRHPMYSALLLILVATPLALGSYIAFPVFALLVPLLAFRAVNEEKLLRQQLPGYADYCQRTRFRLIPFVL